MSSGRPLIGAHSVPEWRQFATHYGYGVFGIFYAFFMAGYVWTLGGEIFTFPAWANLLDLVHDYRVIGVPMFIGGLLGIAGLSSRYRWASLASALVCGAWCGWLSAFAWYSNAQGDSNMSAGTLLPGIVLYAGRFWLLRHAPKPGEPGGNGW